MIEIKKVEDIDLAKKICIENDIDWSDDNHIIATVDNQTVLHCAVFGYENEIDSIDCFDGYILMLDGMCRAILNIMDIHGVREVYMSNKYRRIAEYVGFKTMENGEFYLELTGFFKCGCCKGQ